MPYVVRAKWVAKPGSEDVVEAALLELAARTPEEDGNLVYVPYRDPDEPRAFRIFEVYRDEAAFAEHGRSAHFQAAAATALPLLDRRERRFFTTL